MPATVQQFRAPRGSPIWGHRDHLMKDQLAFIQKVQRGYGDVVPLRIGPIRLWLISDPELIGEVLGTRAASFRKDRGLVRTKILLGDGLLTSEGAEHDQRSRIAQPSFRQKEVERYADAMVEVTARVVDGWREGERLDLWAEFSKIALGIVARTLFGSELLEEAQGIRDALTELLELMEARFWQLVPIPLWVPTPANRKFLRARRVLDDVVYKMIRDRRASGGSGDDLLSRLLAARDPSTSLGTGEGRGLTDEQLRDEVMTLFLAGHETTANALSFAFRLLAEHPGAARKLRDEVDGALGGRPVRAADAPRLPYTAQVFQEALRLYPPAWMLGREASEDVTLGDGRVRIRKDAMVAMSPFLVQRDPRWFADPLAFRPERFAHDAPRPVHHSYFPFGGGKRACIGRSFALLEAAMVIPTVIQRVEFDIDTSKEIGLLPQMTLRPAGGVPARVRVRQVARVAVGTT